MTRHIHFVTGKLAETALRQVLKDLAPKAGFAYSVEVLGISVAALLTPRWVAPRLHPPAEATEIMLPGYCAGDVSVVEQATGLPVVVGPKDLRELPDFFGQARKTGDYGRYDLEIIAEVNHAPRMKLAEILSAADRLRRQGADVIDVGCDPGSPWPGVAEAVQALKAEGHRVSIDSFLPAEIEPAVRHGAELVLSVNAGNREAACDWGVEVVVVPDEIGTFDGMQDTLDMLTASGVRCRIDPILEPIGFGFAHSLGRYLDARRRWPDVEIMMGVGNLTELTDVDSAGVNAVLIGFCQELGIRSVLTTQVIAWAQDSVREIDVARRLMYHAVSQRTLPKRVENRLVMLRDPRVFEHGLDGLTALARTIKDPNYRLFLEGGRFHAMNGHGWWTSDDPFLLFEQLLAVDSRLDPGHAFYLGYELAKASIARTLSKNYRQDQALQWGLLTEEEVSHRERGMVQNQKRRGIHHGGAEEEPE